MLSGIFHLINHVWRAQWVPEFRDMYVPGNSGKETDSWHFRGRVRARVDAWYVGILGDVLWQARTYIRTPQKGTCLSSSCELRSKKGWEWEDCWDVCIKREEEEGSRCLSEQESQKGELMLPGEDTPLTVIAFPIAASQWQCLCSFLILQSHPPALPLFILDSTLSPGF